VRWGRLFHERFNDGEAANLFNEAFVYFDMGYASALAWLLFVIVLALTALLFRTARTWVYEAGTR